MRRWTVLVISHDTEQPRSISVTERALRLAASLAVAVVLIAMMGVGVFVAQLGNLGTRGVRHQAAVVADAGASREIDSLRFQLRSLNTSLDTIRATDSRLRRMSGVSGSDSPTLLQRWWRGLTLFHRPGAVTSRRQPRALQSADSTSTRAELTRSRATADSLVERASHLAGEFGAMADTSGGRSRIAPAEQSRAAPPGRVLRNP